MSPLDDPTPSRPALLPTRGQDGGAGCRAHTAPLGVTNLSWVSGATAGLELAPYPRADQDRRHQPLLKPGSSDKASSGFPLQVRGSRDPGRAVYSQQPGGEPVPAAESLCTFHVLGRRPLSSGSGCSCVSEPAGNVFRRGGTCWSFYTHFFHRNYF